MNQALALEIMLSGESVLLTGPAGAGKTYVLNQFIKLAKHDGKHVSVTATTGLAATHLGYYYSRMGGYWCKRFCTQRVRRTYCQGSP